MRSEILRAAVEDYLNWEHREKWLFLKELAYERIRRALDSPEKLASMPPDQFKKSFLTFCKVRVDGFLHKLTAGTFTDFLENYSLEQISDLAARGRFEVLGNASWSQLHMGFKLSGWEDQKRCLGYLIFGDSGDGIAECTEPEVIRRIGSTLLGSHLVKGLGRAKLTALVLILDDKDRFGVWNTVSNETLERYNLKRRSNLTQDRIPEHYLEANKALRDLRDRYGFRSLADVDQFVWYDLKRHGKKQGPAFVRRASTPSPRKEVSLPKNNAAVSRDTTLTAMATDLEKRLSRVDSILSTHRERERETPRKPDRAGVMLKHLRQSKYDAYWQKRLKEIARLAEQAHRNGKSSALDVSDIRRLGSRRSWYGTVEVSRDGLGKNELAHARSLGKVLLRSNLLAPYGHSWFRFSITQNLKLVAEQLDIPKSEIRDEPIGGRKNKSGKGGTNSRVWDETYHQRVLERIARGRAGQGRSLSTGAGKVKSWQREPGEGMGLNTQMVVADLLRFGESIGTKKPIIFTPVKEANDFVISNSLAFVLGVLFDERRIAEKVWEKPYHLYSTLGHLDPSRIADMNHRELVQVFEDAGLSYLSRYTMMASWTKDLCARICSRYGGDAERIWAEEEPPTVDQVYHRLLDIDGIGQKKASMAVNMLVRDFNIQISGLTSPMTDM